MYLEIQIRWSTVGLCSHQSSDIYTPSCIAAPSYYLWTLEGGIKQQKTEQIHTPDISSGCDASVDLYKMPCFVFRNVNHNHHLEVRHTSH